ncbi:hypothetical protein DH2020_047652 [Rehmannia glutinosa]|uniref:LTI65/LTI78 PGEED repeat domain-containing protein n=1 Tax=Rehmannia glutinosa TaxID=99300 RepID=A0ABR0U7Z5_REHGL
MSPTSGMHHGQEEFFGPSHNKKSVIAKVKERAKKLKHTLSGRKNIHGNELNDVYESEAAPETLKENARQHPRAVPVVSENHRMPNRMEKHEAPLPEINDKKPVSPNMSMTEAVSEKFAPAYTAVSDATHKIASKIAGLTITPPEAQETVDFPTKTQNETHETASNAARIHEAKKMMSENSGNMTKPYGAGGSSPQTWDKGVSVKEYFMNKLEPGEDERALSQAITEAISPRGIITGETGVVEKVKEAVTSLFWQEEPTNSSMPKPASSSSAVPYCSNNITSSTRPTNAHSSKVFYPASAYSSPPIPLSSNAHEGNLLLNFILMLRVK